MLWRVQHLPFGVLRTYDRARVGRRRGHPSETPNVPPATRRGARLSAEQLDSFFVEERRERPIALLPPPTHATRRSGSPAVALKALLSNLSADDRLKVSNERRYGCGPRRFRGDSGVLTFVTQSAEPR